MRPPGGSRRSASISPRRLDRRLASVPGCARCGSGAGTGVGWSRRTAWSGIAASSDNTGKMGCLTLARASRPGRAERVRASGISGGDQENARYACPRRAGTVWRSLGAATVKDLWNGIPDLSGRCEMTEPGQCEESAKSVQLWRFARPGFALGQSAVKIERLSDAMPLPPGSAPRGRGFSRCCCTEGRASQSPADARSDTIWLTRSSALECLLDGKNPGRGT